MADERPSVAESEAYRRRSALETIGDRLARAMPDGALRRGLRAAYRAALKLRSGGRGFESRLPGGERVRLWICAERAYGDRLWMIASLVRRAS